MAVKLYEKDPSKLTAMDEPRPNLSNNSDISDDEDSNQAADIKEEPVDVTTVDENPPLLVPDTSQAVWAATAFPTPHLRERHSFSSGQDDPSTDSDTVSKQTEAAVYLVFTQLSHQETGHALKCRHCSSTFQDMKSLQIHSFLDHNTSEVLYPPACECQLILYVVTLGPTLVVPLHTQGHTRSNDVIPCHHHVPHRHLDTRYNPGTHNIK